ncbi:MAG: CoA pyrophosphatase [Gammaproteobacteria bacterium]|nr:CoA pyrophosphatase [Gammaproteobacteria bacterium]
MNWSRAQLSQLIQQALVDSVPAITSTSQKRAAVLLPLVWHEQAWYLLYIKRAENPHDIHSGQIAFPGGIARADETPLQTALRETQEEIGVLPEAIEVLACLPSMLSITGVQVTPVIGILEWPQTFVLQTTEVSRTLIMPLQWLRQAENYEMKPRVSPVSSVSNEAVATLRAQLVYYRDYEGERLWGLTARMTQDLLALLS